MHDLTPDGRSPQQQIVECYAEIREQEAAHRQALGDLLELLRTHDIEIRSYATLSRDEQRTLRDYYVRNIFPLVTPQAMDPAHPFPFISNLSLNQLVTVRYPGELEQLLTRVKVPVGAGIPRFLRVGAGHHFVPLDAVMAHNLDLLFPGMEVLSCELFRVTRNANTERDEEQTDHENPLSF